MSIKIQKIDKAPPLLSGIYALSIALVGLYNPEALNCEIEFRLTQAKS